MVEEDYVSITCSDKIEINQLLTSDRGMGREDRE